MKFQFSALILHYDWFYLKPAICIFTSGTNKQQSQFLTVKWHYHVL